MDAQGEITGCKDLQASAGLSVLDAKITSTFQASLSKKNFSISSRRLVPCKSLCCSSVSRKRKKNICELYASNSSSLPFKPRPKSGAFFCHGKSGILGEYGNA